jgi:hypothetical protein
MDFDGFLVQMRIEVEGVERAAAALYELSAPDHPVEAPGGLLPAAAADERCR